MISPATVGKIVETGNATCNDFISKDYLKALSLEEAWIQIDINFERKWNLTNCLVPIIGKYAISTSNKAFSHKLRRATTFNIESVMAITKAVVKIAAQQSVRLICTGCTWKLRERSMTPLKNTDFFKFVLNMFEIS